MKSCGKQPVARLAAEALDVDGRPLGERPRRTDRMNAPDEATDPFERLAVFELRRAPPRRGYTAKRNPPNACSVSRRHERRNDRDLALDELERERVLLENLRVGPACWAIELCDDRGRRASASLPLRAKPGTRGSRSCSARAAAVAGETHARKRVEHGIGVSPE